MADIIIPGTPLETRGRRSLGGRPMTSAETMRRTRAVRKEDRLENIAILDMETDPFDPETKEMICPFLAVLYSDNFDPIIIWEEDRESFAQAVYNAIISLPDSYTIYAHNGGKFDYLFLIHLIRGEVKFKGRALMCARIGRHEIRDSLHIIPEKLAAWKKDNFDYQKLRRSDRERFRRDIIEYCVSDCRYLLEIVISFVRRFGFKLSIGQAAIAELRKHYMVKKIGQHHDAALREWFFGGRVECLQGAGYWRGEYRLYDVNSMYPYVMASREHPISNEYIKRRGSPNHRTVFLHLSCLNRGALVSRNSANETDANITFGEFFTTIWEYETALKYGLISDVNIDWCVDNMERSTFADFILPLYAERQNAKLRLKASTKGTRDYEEAKKDVMFFKYLLNNAYGKFAQNPRRYKESFITNPEEYPFTEGEKRGENDFGNASGVGTTTAIRDRSYGNRPVFECARYWIWERPQEKLRFNNVGTAASITGAARAVLMEAIQNADDPIYCDTDSIICRSLANVDLDATRLGAWDEEAQYEEVIIAGKKLYAAKRQGLPLDDPEKYVIKSKGAPGLVWDDYVKMLTGQTITSFNRAPTLTKLGKQFYMQREVRATAPRHHDKAPHISSIPGL